ncbi:MAG: FecR family protein, partial [Planctomycetes bacterium]|nr:FecR family protein [Planctomycetota bacterium]
MTVAPDYHSELYELAGAQCEGAMMADQAARLEELVLGDGRLRRQYILYMQVHAYAEKNAGRGARGEGRRMAGSPAIDLSVSAGVAVELPLQLDLEPQIPNPPFPSLSPLPSPLSPDFVGSWTFACMVATVIVGAMLLGFWAIKITPHQHIAEAPSPASRSIERPEFVFVGRITGLLDVKWSDDEDFLPPHGYAYVPLGHKYKLDSGLMEITYDSGAKVILQGPCTYEVESTAGGYLSLGKLTAKVEKERSEVRSQRSDHYPLSTNSNPQSPIPNPLFSVRTPTAIVTDLGTEFGVEVDETGVTESHVFRGSVKMLVLDGTGNPPSPSGRGAGGEGSGQVVVLRANESARVDGGDEPRVTVLGPSTKTADFIRRIPEVTYKTLDLVDVVAGGDGFSGRRDRG